MNKKGSAILAVIVLSIVLSIYTSTTFSRVKNNLVLEDKYKKVIDKLYEYDDLEVIYDNIVNIGG